MPVFVRRSLLTGIVLASAVLASVTTAGPALAHAELENTSPRDGRTLTVAPRQVSLRFSEPVLPQSVAVVGPQGPVTQGRPTAKGSTVRQALRTGLPSGVYTLQWRVLSDDGDPIRGSSRFRVAAADPTPEPDPTTSAPTPQPTPSSTATIATQTAASTDRDDGDDSRNLILVAIAVIAAVAASAALLARRRRS